MTQDQTIANCPTCGTEFHIPLFTEDRSCPNCGRPYVWTAYHNGLIMSANLVFWDSDEYFIEKRLYNYCVSS